MKKLLMFFCAMLLVFGFLGIGTATANLITNGDFEMLDDRVGNVQGYKLNELNTSPLQWDVYDALPGGWYSGVDDAGIEVQYDGVVVPAHSLYHYIELDSHPGPNSNSSMSQDIMFSEGFYSLSFWYRPRTETEGDNGIDVYFDIDLIYQVYGVASDFPDWQLFTTAGYVDEGLHTITFSAVGLENTLGGFIDTVAINPVPEPATMLLLGSGLIGLGVFGRKKFFKKS